MKICFATQNPNKIREVQALLGDTFELLKPSDFGFTDELREDFETLEENSLQKADTIFQKTGIPCFADDSGLEVDALNGAPGVFSAHFAGPERSAAANMQKVLTLLQNQDNRKARFRTVITLVGYGETVKFEGAVEGEIGFKPIGDSGFGYDPIFYPKGFNRTFAQMSKEEKNQLSHRAKAVQKLVSYLLKSQNTTDFNDQ